MSEIHSLERLIELIVSRDIAAANELLMKAPVLAKESLKVGATRQGATDYFIDEFKHYVYGGDTALHVAAFAHSHELIAPLLSHGADVAARNRRGAQPLHYAADGGPGSLMWNPAAQAATVTALIKAGADPNALDRSGVAPLHRAIRNRCTGAVRALISSGADIRLKNKSGSTPLHLAVQNTGKSGSGADAVKTEQMEVIKLLLSSGATLQDKDAGGKSVEASIQSDWLRDWLQSLV